MGNIAVVICSGEETEHAETKGFMSRIRYAFKLICSKFKPVKVESWFEFLKINEEYGVYLLKLPYETEEFKRLSKKKINSLSSKIAEYCSQKGILSCFLPEILKDCFETGGVFKSLIDKQLLYKSVLIDIIKEIYYESNVVLSHLDVAIIHGSDNNELFRIINLLSGYFNYLTVSTDNKESIEDGLNNIYEEAGLAVGISSDYKNTVKSSQLIIHLGNSNFDFSDCLSSDKVVINYSGEVVNNIAGNCKLINGIFIHPPEEIVQNIKEEVFEFFSKSDIAMILINYRAGFVDTLPCALNETGLKECLETEFKKGGYKIAGFLGNI
jgi:hypothetical protein